MCNLLGVPRVSGSYPIEIKAEYENVIIVCETTGSHSGECEDDSLLGYRTA
jgi:hypothetical protein